MKQMDFDRVREVFIAARDLDGAARSSVLQRECRDDASLRSEVESLLAHHDEQRGRITTPFMPAGSLEELGRGCPPPVNETLPRWFAGFQLLEVIGRGGMGTVYRATQQTPRRAVAVKVIRPGMLTPSMLERFRHEAELLARLQHPGIAQIFEAGEARADASSPPQPYFAMEFIAGRPIDLALNEAGADIRERLTMLAKVCDAVHHAHQKGVIHRDLKPANILVDSGGAPRIVDFGIARAVDADRRATLLQTNVGQLVGTLPYMSPEQVAGDERRLDIRSDVYALGVLLFETLTGALPYDLGSKSLAESVLTLRDQTPARASAIAPCLRGDVETIIGKALEKDPSRRYESAAALADDLRRFLTLRPIVARPPTALYQVRLFARRHRALVAGAALAITSLVLAAALSLGFAWRSHHAAQREARQRQVAERTSEYLTSMLALPDPHRAGSDMTVGEMLDQIALRLDREGEMPEVEAKVRTAIGATYLNLRQSEQALKQLTRAVELWREVDPAGASLGRALVPLGVARLHSGDAEGSEAAYREAMTLLRADEAGLGSLRGGLMDMLIRRHKFLEAAPLAAETLEMARRNGDPVMIVARLRQMARVHGGLHQHDEALRLLDEAIALGERHLPDTHPLSYNVWLDVARERRSIDDQAGALQASTRAYDLSRRGATAGSHDWTMCMTAHLEMLEATGQRDAMLAVLGDAKESLIAAHGPDDGRVRELEARLAEVNQDDR